MISITVCNHKGGTGKTTSTIHLAAAFGLSGYRVLVIDLDPQGFLTRTLGIREPAEEASSLMLFDHQVMLREVPVHAAHSFHVLPSSSTLTKAMRKLNRPTDVLWAKESLQTGVEYDLVLFDTAAAVTVYSLNALVASQFVMIPVTPEYQPVLGAEQTFQTVRLVQERLNPELQNPFFLFTQVDGRKKDHQIYRRYVRDKYGDHVLRRIIRTSTALSDMHPDGTTAFDHDPYSRGARDYANAADELLGHIDPDRRHASLPTSVPLDGEPGSEYDDDESNPDEDIQEGQAPAEGQTLAEGQPSQDGRMVQEGEEPQPGAAWTPIQHLGS